MFLRAMRLKKSDIGGGVVRHAFSMGGEYLRANSTLTPDEVMSINPANRNALIDKGFLAVWPAAMNDPVAKGKRYAIHFGGGAYDVIEGHKLNSKPLTKDEAKALAEGNPPH